MTFSNLITRATVFGLLAGAILAPIAALSEEPQSPREQTRDPGEDCVIKPALEHKYPIRPISDLHEQLTVYKDIDRRSVELQNKLKSGMDCLNGRLVQIRTTVEENVKAIGDGATKITDELTAIARELDELRKRWPPAIHINVPASPVGEPQIWRSLLKIELEQNTILADMRMRMSASSNSTTTIGGNTFNLKAAAEGSHSEKPARDQINPQTPVLDHYPSPHVTVEMAIVTVPDPRVPRHRRQYDNAITAITQGMLRSGYVLDLYAFPWRQEGAIQRESNSLDFGGSLISALKPETQPSTDVEKDGRYGLMLFRRDDWRERQAGSESSKGIHVRALYVVAETGTYGVQALALKDALKSINDQIAAAKAKVTELATRQKADKEADAATKLKDIANAPRSDRSPDSLLDRNIEFSGHPSCFKTGDSAPIRPQLVIFGPTFSGSIDSIREAIEDLNSVKSIEQIDSICLLSASATAATNLRAGGGDADSRPTAEHTVPPKNTAERTFDKATTVECQRIAGPAAPRTGEAQIRYCSLATDDDFKIQFVVNLAKSLKVDLGRVAVVYEATVFGDQICKRFLGKPNDSNAATAQLCAKALTVSFPVNIADVRYGLRAKAKDRENQRDSGAKKRFSFVDDRLSLEDGAENGSEFPESQESPLTAVSTELVLDRLVDEIRHKDPQLIIIVATDVRDRLFLMERMNAVVGNALFVDLGADRLLAHPDFIHATRGTLALSTATLTMISCPLGQLCTHDSGHNLDIWSTDEQAMLFYAVAAWPAGTLGNPQSLPSISDCGKKGVNLGYPICPHVVTRAGLYSSQDSLSDVARLRVVILVGVALLMVATLFIVGWATIGGGVGLTSQGLGANWNTIGLIALGVIAAIIFSTINGSGAMAFVGALAVAIVLVWPMLLGFYWPHVASWSAFGLLVPTSTCAFLYFLVPLFRSSTAETAPEKYLQPLLSALSVSIEGGLAFPLALSLACFALVVCLWISLAAAKALNRSDSALNPGPGLNGPFGTQFEILRSPLKLGGIALFAVGLLLILFELYFFSAVNGRRVTVFGFYADLSALLAIVGTTTAGFGMLVGAIGSALRIQRLSGLIGLQRHGKAGFDLADPKAQPLLWAGRVGSQPPDFATTPVLANASGAGNWISDLKISSNYRDNLDECLTAQQPNDQQLGSLFALLTDELFVYRLAVAGLIVCTLTSGGIVYLFPVSQATPFILINMLLLLAGGVASAHFTVNFESDRILSNVLCNRKQKREWSTSLFLSIVAPFVVLAMFVAIAQIPGVTDVGGGILEVIFNAIRPGGK